MDSDSRKRNLSAVSLTSTPSPIVLPKKTQKMNESGDSVSKMESLVETPSEEDSFSANVSKIPILERKVDEILCLLKSETVKTRLDFRTLETENHALQLKVKESEGVIVKLNSKVQSLEKNLESLQIYSMKNNLVFHNIPEVEQEDYFTVIMDFMKNTLKIPEHLLFSPSNPVGEIRIDTAHRMGMKKEKPRPIIVRFMSHRGRAMVLSNTKNLTQLPYAVSEHLPPKVRERKSAQVPALIEMRKNAKVKNTNTSIKLINDKLMVNSKVNSEAFEKNPLDYTNSLDEPIAYENIFHSEILTIKGSSFQGHIYPIQTDSEAIQVLRAMGQNKATVNCEHTMYAFKFHDADGHIKHGYSDDGEWKGHAVLTKLLDEKEMNGVILIVTHKFGGQHLGQQRFNLIRKVATEVLDNYNN